MAGLNYKSFTGGSGSNVWVKNSQLKQASSIYIKKGTDPTKAVKSAWLVDSSGNKHQIFGASSTAVAYLGSTFISIDSGSNIYDRRPLLRKNVNYTVEEVWGDSIFSYINYSTGTPVDCAYSTASNVLTHAFINTENGTLATQWLTLYSYGTDFNGNLLGRSPYNLSYSLTYYLNDVIVWNFTFDGSDLYDVMYYKWKYDLVITWKDSQNNNHSETRTNLTNTSPNLSFTFGSNSGVNYVTFKSISSISIQFHGWEYMGNVNGWNYAPALHVNFNDPALGLSEPYDLPISYGPVYGWDANNHNGWIYYSKTFSSSDGYPDGYNHFSYGTSSQPVQILAIPNEARGNITIRCQYYINSTSVTQISWGYYPNSTNDTPVILGTINNPGKDTTWRETTKYIVDVALPYNPFMFYCQFSSNASEIIEAGINKNSSTLYENRLSARTTGGVPITSSSAGGFNFQATDDVKLWLAINPTW